MSHLSGLRRALKDRLPEELFKVSDTTRRDESEVAADDESATESARAEDRAGAGAAAPAPSTIQAPHDASVGAADASARFVKAAQEAAELAEHLAAARAAALREEAAALAAADAEFTPAWRSAGLPSRPGCLALDAALCAQRRLPIDPTAATAAIEARRELEALGPPGWCSDGSAASTPAAAGAAAAGGKLRAKPAAAHKQQQQQRTTAVPGGAARKAAALMVPSPPRPPPPPEPSAAECPFVAEPSTVLFSEYSPGGAYRATLRLRNVGAVPRPLRLLPPASNYFHASLPRLPASACRTIAPGMAAELFVHFAPDGARDFDGELRVLTDGGAAPLAVPLRARNAPPMLTLPDVLDVGDVLVGAVRRVRVAFDNAGGAGQFCVVPASSDGSGSGSGSSGGDGQNAGAQAAVCSGPGASFSLSPARFAVNSGGAGALEVAFAPAAPGPAELALLLRDDAGRARPLTLRGRGARVDVRLEGLGPSSRDGSGGCGSSVGSGSDGSPPLWLGAVAPGASAVASLVARNATPLALPFCWRVSDASAEGFAVLPSEGILQPGERMLFDATFAPQQQQQQQQQQQCFEGHASAHATLLVDQAAAAHAMGVAHSAAAVGDSLAAAAAAAAAEEPDSTKSGNKQNNGPPLLLPPLPVASVLLQGLCVPAAVTAEPASIRLPGVLTVGQVAEATVLLHNQTAAEVGFDFGSFDVTDAGAAHIAGADYITVTPSKGTVPSGATAAVTVRVRPSAPGPWRRTLRCSVPGGCALLLPVVADVRAASVAFDPACTAGGVDLGTVKLGATATGQLRLVNASPHVEASWALEQLPNSCGGGLRLQLEPACGRLPPGGACVVEVACSADIAGAHHLPLRLLTTGGTGGAAANSSSSDEEVTEVTVTVDEPDARVEPCRLGLGTLYVGTPERRTLTLRNRSRLAYRFSFALWLRQRADDDQPRAAPQPRAQHHGGTSSSSSSLSTGGELDESSCDVLGAAVYPSSGELAPGESIALELLLDPRAAGAARLYGVCRLDDGFPAAARAPPPLPPPPCGFVLDCAVSGLCVGCQLMAPAEWQAEGCPGAALCSDASAALSLGASVCPPSGLAALPAVIDFGECRLGEPTSRVLVLANATPIAAGVAAWIGQRQEPQASSALSAFACTLQHEQQQQQQQPRQPNHSRGVASAGSAGLRLTAGTADAPAPFASQAAVSHAAARRRRADLTAALATSECAARGLALAALVPGGGALAPRGRIAVEVAALGALPGTYCDVLTLRVGGLPPARVPVVVRVVGSPLSLRSDRAAAPVAVPAPPPPPLALAVRAPPREEGVELALDLGRVPAGVGVRRRQFYVSNCAPWPVGVEWREQQQQQQEQQQPPQPQQQRQQQQRSTEPAAPFAIEPPSAVIPAGGLQRFALLHDGQQHDETRDGRQAAVFFGHQSRVIQRGARSDGADAGRAGATIIRAVLLPSGDAARPVSLLLLGGFHPTAAPPPRPVPALRLEAAATVARPRLELSSGEGAIEWTCRSTAAAPPKHRVGLLNTAGCPLAFRLAVEDGPFELADGLAQLQQQRALILLEPGDSITVPVRFAAKALPVLAEAVGDCSARGALVARFEGGLSQPLPLRVRLAHPAVSAAPLAVDFGRVHPRAPRTFELVLTNYSGECDASWTAAIVEASLNGKSSSSSSSSSGTGAAAVFTVEPTSGLIPASGLGPPREARVTVRCAPCGAGRAAATARFLVARGFGAEVALAAFGSFEE